MEKKRNKSCITTDKRDREIVSCRRIMKLFINLYVNEETEQKPVTKMDGRVKDKMEDVM